MHEYRVTVQITQSISVLSTSVDGAIRQATEKVRDGSVPNLRSPLQINVYLDDVKEFKP